MVLKKIITLYLITLETLPLFNYRNTFPYLSFTRTFPVQRTVSQKYVLILFSSFTDILVLVLIRNIGLLSHFYIVRITISVPPHHCIFTIKHYIINWHKEKEYLLNWEIIDRSGKREPYKSEKGEKCLVVVT